MLFAPGANQGPLLGILITGPLGLVIGCGVGIWREWRRSPEALAAPAEWLSHPATRLTGGVLGVLLVLNGMAGVRRGEGRGPAAAIVLGVVVVWWAVTGRVPGWFRR